MQLVHGVHDAAFVPVEYVPAAHASHVRSVVALPAEATRSPGSQSDHAVHDAAFVVAEYVPAAHAEHVRSEVAVPALATRSPGSQTVHPAQDVAPAADQVPAAQSVHAVAPLPSAEKVPAGHALHAKVPLISEQLVAPSQGLVTPSHVPASHASVVVHASPSSHALPVVGPHVPSVAAPAATLHAWQSSVPPLHEVAQQTPSVQKPLTQSVFVLHALPSGWPRSSFAMKASQLPAIDVCTAPVVVGKFIENVCPVMYVAPAPSTAMPWPMSELVPPR